MDRGSPAGNVVGIGLDLVEVARLEQAEARWGKAFLDRVFTPREIADCGEGVYRAQRLAARFCAKEAVFKALGQGRPRLDWIEVEVVRAAGGQPGIVLSGRALARAKELGVDRVLVSLTHISILAMAEAVALGRP